MAFCNRSVIFEKTKLRINIHAINMELMTTRQTHDAADAIHVFFQAYNTFDLFAHILLPLS